jgi:uncharacterized protein (DUF1499 family)
MPSFKHSTLWANIALMASIACIATIIISILGVRGDWMGIRTAFTNIRYASQAGIAVIIGSVLVFAFARGAIASRIKSGLAIVLVLIPVMSYYSNQPAKTPPGPPLNDISTDTINPPLFDAVVALRPQGSNDINYPGDLAAARQKELFPDIAPIRSSASKEDAFNHSLSIAKAMNWEIVSQEVAQGIIEAVASTPVFDFQDDVVIRIQSNDTGSTIDIRSHSRIGRGDQGKNAERVRQFIEQFNDLK